MGYPSTISGKEFCKRNSGAVGKERFYEEYYRILHTSYLRAKEESCIDIIKREFLYTFGVTPDKDSVSYIYSTAKYFVYDVVISSLLTDGKIDSSYYLSKLVIEIGFDVWLMDMIEQDKEIKLDEFRSFVALEKNEKNQKAVEDFLFYKLPKTKDYKSLYNALKEYKSAIQDCYNKLLTANELISSSESSDSDTVDSNTFSPIYNEPESFVSESKDTTENSTIQAKDEHQIMNDADIIVNANDETKLDDLVKTDDVTKLDDITKQVDITKPVDITNPVNETIPVASADITDVEVELAQVTAVHFKNIKIDEIKEEPGFSKPVIKVNQTTDSSASLSSIPELQRKAEAIKTKVTEQTKAQQTIDKSVQVKVIPPKGKFITKEKVETVAKCLAFAGIMLIPLICYKCAKKH